MGSEQSGDAPAPLMRRLGRGARGDRHTVGAYPPKWQERAASDVPAVPGHRPAVAAPAVDGFAVPAVAATEG